jgi:hypothetical protein
MCKKKSGKRSPSSTGTLNACEVTKVGHPTTRGRQTHKPIVDRQKIGIDLSARIAGNGSSPRI